MRTLVLGLCAALSVTAAATAPHPVCDKPPTHAPEVRCKHPRWRLIGEERVPWDHSEDDHEWDEFDHTTDECEPPPC